MGKSFWLIFLAGTMAGVSWAQSGPVVVYFNPASTTVTVGQTFQVNLMANLPDPVLGWGLDVSINPAVLTQTAALVSDPPWMAVLSPDGDNLAGLAFPAVAGNGVVLATLTFQARAAGTSPLVASVTADDLTEGFPLAPPAAPGTFAPVTVQNGSVMVKSAPPPIVPAILPLGLAILAGLLGLVGARRQRA